MIPSIKNAFINGRLMLLLGAGASYKSTDSDGVDMPMGDDLAAELAKLKNWSYKNEALSVIYSAINSSDSALLHSYLRKRMTNTQPSPALRALASFPWSRIFTLNIDDCTEIALRDAKIQIVRILGRNSPLEDADPILRAVQLIKLNGSADRPEDGFIFSPQEYGEGSARIPVWYRELGQDYSSYPFVFIGSKLNEPLFQHAIAEMRSTTKRNPLEGYVITPSASEIEIHHLRSLNLVHVPGSLESFTEWLAGEFPTRPTPWDLATAKRPELRYIDQSLSDPQKRALNSITVVSAATLPSGDPSTTTGAIREFYKGYKPRWVDITDEVPAILDSVRAFSSYVEATHVSKKCIMLVGPAGSGKSTALMIAALHVSNKSGKPVYYLREAVSGIKELMQSLEQLNSSGFYLFIDKIDAMHQEIGEFLVSNKARNICVVATERLNIWNRRLKGKISEVVSNVSHIGKISSDDVTSILVNLEKYGPWTRLQSMSEKQRKSELFNKADRQLLIGLLEVTTGLGFTKIIANDFEHLGNDQHRMFLVIVGLATIHRSSLSAPVVGLALSNLGIKEDVNILLSETEGITQTSGKKLSARHPVYVRELFEQVVSTSMIRDCIVALLEAFANYETPIVKHISRSDGIVFKSIINHRFVQEMMRSDEAKVISVYAAFETRFHIDGLYWLQYGLALRHFGRHPEALDKLKTAKDAYESPQIDHAYAQQLMIMASRHALKWDDAEPELHKAIVLLRELQRLAEPGDSYPIVTLAEGHISVVLKFFGVEGAKDIASQYANELLVMFKKHPSQRLQESVAKVLGLSTTGTWSESFGPGFSEEE